MLEKHWPKWDGIIKVKNSGTFAVQIKLYHDPNANLALSSFLDSRDLTVYTVIPFRSVKYLCRQISHLITEIKITDSDYLHWSKFTKLLYVNKQAAIVRSSARPTAFLILTNTFRSNWVLEKPELGTAIFIENMEMGLNYAQYRNIPSSPSSSLLDPRINSSWKAMAHLLRFPDELASIVKRRDIVLRIIGTSGLARSLRSAHRSSRATSISTLSTIEQSSASEETGALSPLALSLIEIKNILLFDRSDDRLYRTPLKTERNSNDTMIFQFGSNGPTDPITPPSVVYPKNTGGYITTDVKNILMNPDILDKIVEFAQKKNSLLLGTWKPILHTECLNHIMRSGTGIPAQNAISKILFWLASKDIGILENWGETVDEAKWKVATFNWFDTIARTHSNELEAFFFVDDVPNNRLWHHCYPAIDFINSDALL